MNFELFQKLTNLQYLDLGVITDLKPHSNLTTLKIPRYRKVANDWSSMFPQLRELSAPLKSQFLSVEGLIKLKIYIENLPDSGPMFDAFSLKKLVNLKCLQIFTLNEQEEDFNIVMKILKSSPPSLVELFLDGKSISRLKKMIT